MKNTIMFRPPANGNIIKIWIFKSVELIVPCNGAI